MILFSCPLLTLRFQILLQSHSTNTWRVLIQLVEWVMSDSAA